MGNFYHVKLNYSHRNDWEKKKNVVLLQKDSIEDGKNKIIYVEIATI